MHRDTAIHKNTCTCSCARKSEANVYRINMFVPYLWFSFCLSPHYRSHILFNIGQLVLLRWLDFILWDATDDSILTLYDSYPLLFVTIGEYLHFVLRKIFLLISFFFFFFYVLFFCLLDVFLFLVSRSSFKSWILCEKLSRDDSMLNEPVQRQQTKGIVRQNARELKWKCIQENNNNKKWKKKKWRMEAGIAKKKKSRKINRNK